MSSRYPSLLGSSVGFGHRGAMARAPENTIESFQLALELGANGVESDVWLTADGVPVLDHDGRIGTIRRRSISNLAKSDLPDHIPSLAELFELVGPDMPISLDLKDPAAFEPVVATARKAGDNAEKNLWICHPDIDQLTSWRQLTTAKLINSTRLKDLDGGPERRAAELQQRGIDGLNLFHTDWSGGRVALLHRFDRLALAWGAQHERELAKVIDIGIDAVYSDHVDRMMAVMAVYYGPSSH